MISTGMVIAIAICSAAGGIMIEHLTRRMIEARSGAYVEKIGRWQ